MSVLFLIAGIHSTTNIKTYEQAKNFFNPAIGQSSSEESFSPFQAVGELMGCVRSR